MDWLLGISNTNDFLFNEKHKYATNHKLNRRIIFYSLRIYVGNFMANNHNQCFHFWSQCVLFDKILPSEKGINSITAKVINILLLINI